MQWLYSIRGWRSKPKRAVWSNLIVLSPPVLNKHLCQQQRREYLSIKQLVSQLPIECLDTTILSGATLLRQNAS
jgi:hypothetical protein